MPENEIPPAKPGDTYSSIMQYSSIFAKKQPGQPTEDEIIDEK